MWWGLSSFLFFFSCVVSGFADRTSASSTHRLHRPTAKNEIIYHQGEVLIGLGACEYHRVFWLLYPDISVFRVSVECILFLPKVILAVKPPSYQSVLELDRTSRILYSISRRIDRQIFVRIHYATPSKCIRPSRLPSAGWLTPRQRFYPSTGSSFHRQCWKVLQTSHNPFAHRNIL